MSQTPAWPFLISTDATSGFVTIVAPQFMLDAGTADLLRLVTDGEITPTDAVYLRTLMGAANDALIVAYRIAPATGALLDRDDDTLYDHQGRRILLIEGIVVAAHPAQMTQLALTASDFAAVQAAYRAAFRARWEHDDHALAPLPSVAFSLAGDAPLLRHMYQPALMLPSVAPPATPPVAAPDANISAE